MRRESTASVEVFKCSGVCARRRHQSSTLPLYAVVKCAATDMYIHRGCYRVWLVQPTNRMARARICESGVVEIYSARK